MSRTLSTSRALGDRALSSARSAAARTVALGGLVVCDGDSLTYGEKTATPWSQSYPAQLAGQINASVINLGIPGMRIDQLASVAAWRVDGLLSQVPGRNVLVVLGGTNDLAQAATAATVESRLQSYCAARKAAGWTVAVQTIMPAGGTTPAGFEVQRAIVNPWLRANWPSFADVLVDLAAEPRLQTTTNTTYFYSDGVHLSATGYGVIAELVRSALGGF